MSVVRFLFLAVIKLLSRAFYRFEVEWVGVRPAAPFRDARVGVLLNHTSLFEPILSGVFPWHWLWAISKRGLLPGADVTLDRPVAGRLIKLMVPKAVTVTRTRDRTWTEFLSHITEEDVVLISPEGRMKRRSGLDKHGKPMSLRGGIIDVLDRKSEGTLLLVYSEGLHHVQAPGEGFPHLFKRVRARLEEIPLALYKMEMGHGTPEFRANVIADLERRRDLHCPWD